jgi:integrase
MSRPKKPWFRKGRNAWYIELGGRQIKLADGPKNAVTEALAWEEFRRLMVEIADNPPVDGGNPTVASICDEYLERNQSVLASSTLYENRLYLQKFCDRHGPRLVRDCIPYHLVTWVQEHPSWESKWTQSYAIRVVKRAFNWAAEMGLISENPFASVKPPRGQSKRRPIKPEEYKQLLDAAGEDSRLGEILRFLRLTGCRPGELRQLRWQDVHMESEFPAIVIEKHKTSSTQSVPMPRIIPILPELGLLLTTIAERQEHEKYVFVTSRRLPWARSSIQQSIRRIRRRIGLSDDVVLYAIRHGVATSLVRNGNDLRTIADLLGHTNVRTTELYIHSTDQLAALTEAMSRLAKSA